MPVDPNDFEPVASPAAVNPDDFEPVTPPRSAPGEVWTGLKRGLYQGVQGAGEILQTPAEKAGLQPGIISKAGQALEQFGKSGAEANAPQEASHGPITNFLSQAAAAPGQAIPVLAGAIGGAAAGTPIAGPVGEVVGGAIGGGSAAALQAWHEKYQEGLAQNMPDAQARDYADKSAAVQGGAMAAMSAVPFAGPIAGKVIGSGAKTAAETAADTVGKKFLPQFAKQSAEIVGANTGIGVASAAGQAAVDQQSGVKGPSPWEAAKAAALPSLAGSVGFIPLGALHAAHTASEAAKTQAALADPDAHPLARMRAVNTVIEAMKKVDPNDAKMWSINAVEAVKQGKPIGLDDSWIKGGGHPSVFPPAAGLLEAPRPIAAGNEAVPPTDTTGADQHAADVYAARQAEEDRQSALAPISTAAQETKLLPPPGGTAEPQIDDAAGQFPLAQQHIATAAADHADAIYTARAQEEARLQDLASHGPISAAAAQGIRSGLTDVKTAERQEAIPQAQGPKPGEAVDDNIGAWTHGIPGESLADAQGIAQRYRATGKDFQVVPHPEGGYAVMPAELVAPDLQQKYAGIQTAKPTEAPSLMPFATPDVAQKRAADLTAQSGVEHEVIPHPAARDKFAVQPKPVQEATPEAEQPITAEQPKEPENAVQEPSAGGVLQRQPGQVGEAGGERGRVESGEQGTPVAQEGAAKPAEESPAAGVQQGQVGLAKMRAAKAAKEPVKESEPPEAEDPNVITLPGRGKGALPQAEIELRQTKGGKWQYSAYTESKGVDGLTAPFGTEHPTREAAIAAAHNDVRQWAESHPADKDAGRVKRWLDQREGIAPEQKAPTVKGPTRISLFLKKLGGLDTKEAPDTVGEKGMAANRQLPGLFVNPDRTDSYRHRGHSLDQLVHDGRLDEYLPHDLRQSNQDEIGSRDRQDEAIEHIRDLVRSDLSNKRGFPYEDRLRAELSEQEVESAKLDELPPEAAKAAAEGTLDEVDDIPFGEGGALNQTEDDVFGGPSETKGQVRADQGAEPAAGSGKEGDGGAGQANGNDNGEAPKLELTGQTKSEAVADAEKQKADAAAKAEADRAAEQKAQADKERDEFTLTGSNRVADEAAVRGQQDLLGGGKKYQYSEPLAGEAPVESEAKRLVVDAMNGDLSVDALIAKLRATGLPNGALTAITERLGDRMSAEQQRKLLAPHGFADTAISTLRGDAKGVWIGELVQNGDSFPFKVVNKRTNRADWYVEIYRDGKVSDSIPFPAIRGMDTAEEAANKLLDYVRADNRGRWSVKNLGVKHQELYGEVAPESPPPDATPAQREVFEQGASLEPARTPVKIVESPKETNKGTALFSKRLSDSSSSLDTQLHAYANIGGTASELLTTIEKKSASPFNRELAAHLKSLGINPKIEGGVAPDSALPSEGGRVAGSYERDTNTVHLFTATNAERHLLHELVHAATAAAIDKGTMAGKQMEALYRAVKDAGLPPGTYGLKSVHEFVAEAHANPKFQAMLDGIKDPTGKTMWQKFVGVVRRILGIPADQATALDQALRIGKQLMDENAQVRDLAERSPLFSVKDDEGDDRTVRPIELEPKITGGKAAQSEAQFTKSGKIVREKDAGPQPIDKAIPKWLHGADPKVVEAARKAGAWVESKPLKQRLKEQKHEAGLRILQAAVDQYASIQERLGDMPYKLARMASSYDAGVETLLHYGQIRLNDAGAIERVQDSKGVLEILKPLQGETDRFMMWMAGQRADRLSKEDREHNFGSDDISALKSLNGKMHADDNLPDGSDGKGRTMLYAKVAKEFMDTQKSMLDLAVKAGTLTPELRDTYANQFYVPFYREAEDGRSAVRAGNISGLVNQYFSKRLKGGDGVLHDLLANTVQNWSHLVQSSLKNNAATKILDAAETQGYAHKLADLNADAKEAGFVPKDLAPTNSVFVLKDGKPVHYVIDDPLLLDSVSALGASPFRVPKSLAWFKHALTVGTTMSPIFRVRHTIREQIASLILGHGSYNPVKNWVDGFKYSSRNNPEYGNMLAGGSFFRMGYGYEDNRGAYFKQLLNHDIDTATVLDSPTKVKRALEGAWDWWKETGERSDSITRANRYRNTYAEMIAAGKSPDEAHFEASYAARSTLDYGLHGTSAAIKMITGVVPFMNARLQGLYVIGKAAHADPKRFATVMGGVTLATMALTLAYRNDKEMQAREEWDRDNNWAFRIGDKMFRVPKPFELGAMATIADRALEVALNGFNPSDRERFADRIIPIIGSQLNMNPLGSPVVAAPLEIWGNKDWFSGRAIETYRDQRLKPTERFNVGTSATALAASKAMNSVLPDKETLSPEQIDFAISALFGWVGLHAVMTADLALRPMTGMADKPAMRVDDLPVVGDFVKTLPQNQSRFTEAFYQHLIEVQQAFGSMRSLQQMGQAEKAMEVMKENKNDIALHGMYLRTQRQLGQLNRQERYVNMKNMGADEKREELNRIAQIKNGLTEMAEKTRAQALDRQ